MKKFKLVRTWVDKKRGNPYFPGVYYETQLPEFIRNNSMYCLPLEEIEVAVKEVKPDPNVIDLRVNKDSDVINITKQELVVNKLPEEDSSSKFDINTAKLQDLITVKGIGQKTAEKIIGSRPYNELNDLTKALSSTAIKNIDLSKLQC